MNPRSDERGIWVRGKIKNFLLIEISSKLSFDKALKDLAKKHNIKRVGLDHHDITVAEHKKFSSLFKTIMHFDIDGHRTIKTNQEILAIEKPCRLGDKAFDYVLKKIKQGITEKQLSFEIEFFIKKAGGDISFPPIVAFGKNSAIPHHKPSDQRLASGGQFVLLDFGVKLNNYCSDMTRTVFFGKPTNEQKRMYKIVLEAQKRAIEQLSNEIMKQSKNKIKASNIDRAARSYITSKDYPTIPHSLGHGIGLEVHESPRLSPKSQPRAGQHLAEKDILKPGMVFTIEPGIYIPGFGGVRIEDIVVLEKSGPRTITKSPKEISEI